jgi:hypothetical protein
MLARGFVAVCVTGAALAWAAPASATTFCVPNFHAACPNNGVNVAQANLETAMQANGSDGTPDTIVVDAGVRTDSGAFQATGSDALEIVGAGPGTTAGATRLTTSSIAATTVVDLFTRASVTMRNLTVVLPVTVPPSDGLAVQAGDGDILESVDAESANHTHQRAIAFAGSGTYNGGRIYGVNGGGFLSGVRTSFGALSLSGLTITNAVTAVDVSAPTASITVRRSRIQAPQVGVSVTQGGAATVENVVITDPAAAGVAVGANTADAVSATIRHTTIARVFGLPAALPLMAEVANNNGNGNASISVRSSIFRGFDDSYRRSAPVDPAIGNANILFTHSNLPPTGAADAGDGAATLGDGNIDSDPLFAGASDFHLRPGSPSIDTGDPASPVVQDFDGAPRPTDGNGDSVARSDMGAFELQPPPPPTPPLTGAPPAGPTGERAAALKKCKRKRSKKKRRKCRRAARRLPV